MSSISNKLWRSNLCVWELSQMRLISLGSNLCTVATTSTEQENDKSLTKEKARILVMNLTIAERDNLAWSLNHLVSEETKAEYRGLVPTKAMFEPFAWSFCFKHL